MGLFGALNVAVSGLRINQQGLEVVSGNIANSETPGYTRKTLGQFETAIGGQIIGVRRTEVGRELDALLQRQIRSEGASSGYFDVRKDYLARLDQSLGIPGGANALDTLYNNFTTALQALTTSPDSPSVRTNVINEASFFASRLNTLSGDIQAMRTEAEVRLASATDEVNALLVEIERLTNVVIAQSYLGNPEASLLDQRDRNIDQLSKLLDVQVVNNDGADLKIFTNSGVALFDKTAVTLTFDQRSLVTATNHYSTDPNARGVGTIMISSGVGEVDLLSANYIRSGEIAAYVELRDRTLVDAQAQLDEIAHNLALALGTTETAGTAAAAGAQTGYALDIAALGQPGDSVTLNYTENGTAKTVTFIRVDDPTVLPLSNDATANPDDMVIGVDYSGGAAAAANWLVANHGLSGITIAQPGGAGTTTLQFLDDGAAATTDVSGVAASVAETGFSSGNSAAPVFVDGASNAVYSGALDGHTQKLGFAARIAVNTNLAANPAHLVKYAAATEAGDPTRPMFLFDRLTQDTRHFTFASSISASSGAYGGTVSSFIQEVAAYTGQIADMAAREKEGQDIVMASLEARYSETSGVDIDEEMTRLIMLQNSYAANARVISVAQEMLDQLLNM